MTEQPTPRQVLYALVSGGFVVVVAILTIAGAIAGLVPGWWSATLALAIASSFVFMALRWRDTTWMLVIGIGLLVMWMVGTLALAG